MAWCMAVLGTMGRSRSDLPGTWSMVTYHRSQYVRIRTIRTNTYDTYEYVRIRTNTYEYIRIRTNTYEYVRIRTIRTIRTNTYDTYDTYEYVHNTYDTYEYEHFSERKSLSTKAYVSYVFACIRTYYVTYGETMHGLMHRCLGNNGKVTYWPSWYVICGHVP